MEVFKQKLVKIKEPLFLTLMEEKENAKFTINVSYGGKNKVVYNYVVATIISKRCKCWTAIYHIVIDHFLRCGKSRIETIIQQNEFGVTLLFLFPDNRYGVFTSMDVVRDKLGEIFESILSKEDFFLDYSYKDRKY